MSELLNVTIGQIVGGSVGIVILISVFFEITPIKINPVSKFLAWIGRKTNKDISSKVETLDKEIKSLKDNVDNIEKNNEEQKAINCRIRILQFGDEIRHGTMHSEEAFNQVLHDITEYENYCTAHPGFSNDRTVITTERIKAVYKKCLDVSDPVQFLN